MDKLTDRYAVLVYSDGYLQPDKTRTAPTFYLAQTDLKDAINRIMFSGASNLAGSERVVFYDMEEDRIIYSLSAEWNA